MNQPFSLIPRSVGRAQAVVDIGYVRDLNEADVVLTHEERGIQPVGIQKLRDRHHSLARCLAAGMHDAEASLITGYSVSRVSILKKDPTFQELVAFYHQDTQRAFANVQDRMASLSLDAVDELHSRLEDKPEEFEVDDLIDVAKLTLDRTGQGPQTKSLNVNVNVGLAERMKTARERVQSARLEDRRQMVETVAHLMADPAGAEGQPGDFITSGEATGHEED